jgi:hypothetical protein
LPFLCFFSLFNFNWDLNYRRREVMPALAIHWQKIPACSWSHHRCWIRSSHGHHRCPPY